MDKITDIQCYVQGGALGQIGHTGDITGSLTTDTNILTPTGQGSTSAVGQTSLINSMTIDNTYSGSFEYEMSFLDKDHTIILDLNKDTELENGIGSKGAVIIPETTISKVANNIEFYLAQAGIITSTVSLTQNLSTTNNPPPGV